MKICANFRCFRQLSFRCHFP